MLNVSECRKAVIWKEVLNDIIITNKQTNKQPMYLIRYLNGTLEFTTPYHAALNQPQKQVVVMETTLCCVFTLITAAQVTTVTGVFVRYNTFNAFYIHSVPQAYHVILDTARLFMNSFSSVFISRVRTAQDSWNHG